MATSTLQESANPTTEVEMTYAEAGVEALRQEMQRDPKVFYMGQGIGSRGGNYGQTRGLWAEFGDHRVRDTPISELGQTGLGIGAAMAGFRPVVDIVFLDMIMEAMGQIVQQAAITHYTTNGKIKVPMVIRGAMGSAHSAGPHHSRVFYSWFVNTPGLKVVTPSTPADVKGLMKTAIRDDNPVMFIEHKSLYTTKGRVPAGEYLIPFGKARVCREGKDVTVVAVSLMVAEAVKAATSLSAQGIDVEVLDPRTPVPLDKEAILQSVSKTGRLVIVDEGPPACSFASEIAAVVATEKLEALKAPVRLVCALPVPHPFNPALEEEMLPSAQKIESAVKSLLRN